MGSEQGLGFKPPGPDASPKHGKQKEEHMLLEILFVKSLKDTPRNTQLL
jgi:hypothetical protein